VNAAFAGQSSGTVYEGERRFDLVVRLSGEQRKNLQDVQNLLIPTSKEQIPLNAVAKVEIIEGPNQIQRENAQRRIIVGFNVRGRDVQSMVNELKEKVETQIKLPPGYFVTYGGAFENLVAAKQRLSIAVPVSLLLIFLMLYFTFRSVKQGLLIYSAIPLSMIGGILALAIRGMPFSISAGIGFIALFGVAVLNGIVLIAEFNRLKKEGLTDLKRIVTQGTKVRLRPVLMTAFVASLGFLPMALSTGEGAEVQRPLATVVIGGLLIATFLTLFVLPILYIMFEKGISFKRKKVITITSVLLMMLFSVQNVNAQKSISLKAATDTALKNNLSIKNEKLRADYQQKLIKTAKIIPPTNVTGDFGQINSFYTDTKLSVTQTISFPKVYSTQKTLLNEEWKSSVLNTAVKETELRKQVAQIYYTLLYLQQKKELLQKADSLFTEFLEKATLRFNKGESNILEKTTAENQQGQIRLQLNQLKNDMDLLQLQFQLLLNTTTVFIPDEKDPMAIGFKVNVISNPDTSFLKEHPAMQYYQQRKQIAAASTQVEKSKLLPDLILGYNLMSIRGTGANNKEYNSIPQFQSVQIGLGIPIFNSGQKAKINAARVNEMVVASEYEVNLQNFENAYKTALLQYEKNNEAVAYFEKTALKNAEIITTSVTQKFINGDINYLEWVMLVNQAISIQGDYIEAVKNLNKSAVEINSFINQKNN
jgi:cobalt-zinc-cadmium resistance protein CzcA